MALYAWLAHSWFGIFQVGVQVLSNNATHSTDTTQMANRLSAPGAHFFVCFDDCRADWWLAYIKRSGQAHSILWFITSRIGRRKQRTRKNHQKIHTTVGEIGYYVIALHAAAALFHHYIVKDNTLRRMLPSKKS